MGVPDVSYTAASVTDSLPLSLQQEFFCSLDKGDITGAFGRKHTITFGWRVRGGVASATLRAALDDIVVRHEILRSSLSRGEVDRAQHVHPPCPVKLTVRELPGGDQAARDRQAQDLINDVEADGYDVTELPHLRAFLGVFDDSDAVLVLIAHHIASDGWSMRVIMRDLAACYAARKAGREPDLPAVSQYHEYSRWQQEHAASAAVDKSAEYWRTTLKGAQIFAMPTDRAKSGDGSGVYSTHRFGIDSELTSATVRLANAMRCSPFMLLLAVYKTMLCKKFGVTDIVVATFTSSRGEERFQNTVGPFLNFLPLRTDLTGCANFRDVVTRVRRTCLEAYTHDIPFERIEPEAPDLMAPFGNPSLDVIAFEVLQFPSAMHNTVISGLEYTEIRRRLVSQPVSSDIPDGALWALDILPDGDMAGSLKFSAGIFDYRTMSDLVGDFDALLRSAVAGPDLPLSQL
jgi:hypothetical protein